MTPSVESGGSEVFTGASSTNSGQSGIVPAPSAGSSNRYLCADGTWSTVPDATTSTDGLMTSSDKSKLNGIASGANRYVHPSYTEVSSGLYKVAVDSTGHISEVTPVTKSDITALGFSDSAGSGSGGSSVTYGTGTSTVSGLTKLYTGTGTNTDGTMTQAAIKSALDGKASSTHNHTKSQISDFPSSMPASDVYSWAKQSTKPTYTASEVGLGNVGNFKAVSTVASQGLSSTEKANARTNIGAGTSSFSGSYTDLTNKPSIPSVGNGTITITQNGTSKGSFSMNQSGNATIALTDTNTNTWRPQPDWNATSGDAVILNKPTIPTNTNQLTNGAGFTTNTGTITGIKMNGSSKGTSGVVDLGNVLTYNSSGDISPTGHVYLKNGKSVRSYTSSGSERQVIGLNDSNNIMIGYGTYSNKDTSSTVIGAGNRILFQLGKQDKTWHPYFEAGDSITINTMQCGGYITGAGKEVYFVVPLDRPVLGGTTITVTSVNGLVVRQAGKYVFGSNSDGTYAKPASYTVSSFVGGINVRCVMSNSTNSTNNDACGVYASIKITFS